MTVVANLPACLAASAASIPSQLLGSGVIGLREGLESAIVVTILVAFLIRSNRYDAVKWVWLGVAAAIAVTIGVFLTIQFTAYTVSDRAAEAIGGVASLAAVSIVTTMVLWMKKAAAGLSGELRDEMARALQAGSLAVLLLAFLAVGREGIETALFMVGFAKADTAWPLTGLVLGAGAAALIAYGMYAGVIHLNLSTFFTYTGAFLVLVAAGILASGVGALQKVGWLPGAHTRAFDASMWFDWSSWYGQLIRGVFSITPTPTVLRFGVWFAYLIIVLPLFLRRPAGASARISGHAPGQPG
ncbi:iron uptake transporter permease EfeU [Mycobacterium botniense]|uniref:Putative iron permease FTR1 n=1 Tax=Mycobacterium botniense TaxID=84962 RepID=A0A7I9XYJ5_9MYCO|nr:iron uptake transporter permease EfeU [Mycobacterium botniense]GFG74891.1 putative iron permease FTR1 [Mycobacterium botniense]